MAEKIDRSTLADGDPTVLARERARDQVNIIRNYLGEENVGVATREGQTLIPGGGHGDGDGDADHFGDFHYLYYQGRVLVRDEDLSRTTALIRRAVNNRRLQVSSVGLIEGVTQVNLPATLAVDAFLARADADLGVGVVTPDHILHVTPKDGSGRSCPATEPEPAEGRPVPPWSTRATYDGEGVLVCVVDTGLHPPTAQQHAWLAGVTGEDENVVDKDDKNVLAPYAGHGTFIAGVIRCVAPEADVYVENYLDTGGAISESAMITKLSEALSKGPDIISLSAGTLTRNDRRLLTFQVFWETQLRHLKGTVLVAAAGNDGDRVPFWPAAFPWSVSVGAIDQRGKRADFSNFGSWVDVYAPGVDLVNAYPKGEYKYREPENASKKNATFSGMAKWSGTSFSTPIVSGMIAARMSGTGESASLAANALLRHAQGQSKKGVGAWLEPDDASYGGS